MKHVFVIFLVLIMIPLITFADNNGEKSNMTRIAHYVASTHWDREWYEPFQGFRMRLVSMLDEVYDTFDKDKAFKAFVMDGQTIPVCDYLEIRPENRARIEEYVKADKFKLGPWYVLPDEWLVSGESLVRNLQMGMETASSFGAPSSRAGFMCDMFGHVGQMPQIFDQMNISAAFVWRGTLEKELHGHFNWKAPDGTIIPTYRFARTGYCTYAFDVRNATSDEPFDLDKAVDKLVAFVEMQSNRSKVKPILVFDGGDHLEIEPQTSKLLALANKKLESQGITIVHSTLDNYIDDLLKERSNIPKTLEGELRESSRDPGSIDEQWLIPGVLSSRIHLKQRNALCEDELCLWAEPFSAFAGNIGYMYPASYLYTSWKHLIENHPHDSICGCSIDQVHQDMIYRFDQSYGISSRLTEKALNTVALAAAPQDMPDNSIMLAVFNATAEKIDEPVDLDIPLPTNWPKRYQEFFGYEEKFSFKLFDAQGEEIPYQLVSQVRDSKGFRRLRYKFPKGDNRHIVTVTARLHVPSFGYTTVMVEPVDGPTRYLGSMALSHRSIGNEFLTVQTESNGTITIRDKRNGKQYDQLLTFEDCADIGDGWYHGLAVNDLRYLSSASGADVALIADGINKATLRITVTMNVPEEFDFAKMMRREQTAPLKIVSDVTLRKGSDRVEVTTTVDNTILDHRVRVLFPTHIDGDTYLSDSAYDVVRRPVALKEDNNIRRELDVETRPQITWTAFGDGKSGLAVVSRGLPENAVINIPDRPITLTLLRAFRRAVMANDNPGGQIQGTHTFNYDIVPVVGEIPVNKLFLLGQRVNRPVQVVDILPIDAAKKSGAKTLPRELSFLNVEGKAVVTSVQRDNDHLLVRLFNPHGTTEKVTLELQNAPVNAKCVALDGRDDTKTTVLSQGKVTEVLVPPKRIATIRFKE
ncbi:MAG: glycoside hydrolase family 38 [Candidatus Latescibacteria bacterium]|nr:glycoside hydrolase family 38 [Candidatus Latescibacterota bacterium]